MLQRIHSKLVLGLTFLNALTAAGAPAFEGRISAVISRGSLPMALLYTVGTNCLRIEMTDTNSPNTVDLLDRNTGTMTLLFPQSHCFMRLKPAANASAAPPGFPAMPAGPPPGIGAQPQPGPAAGAPTMPSPPPPPAPPGGLPPDIGPTNLPGAPQMPSLPGMPNPPARPPLPAGLPLGIGPQAQAPTAPGVPALPNPPGNRGLASMPAMPMLPPGGGLTLQATGGTTNLLGYTCTRYEIKQWGQTMEIWATDQLLPFQGYLPTEPPRFGPPMIEEDWAGLLAARKLFPLLASLRMDNGVERYHFEVQSIQPARLMDKEAKAFQTPEDYVELQPRPF